MTGNMGFMDFIPTLVSGSVQCAMCNVQCAVCSVQCAVYSLQCAVCNDLGLKDFPYLQSTSPSVFLHDILFC